MEITLLSIACRGIESHIESEAKILQKSSHFWSSERLLALNIAGIKKPLGKLAVVVDIDTLEAMRFELSMNGALETVEICVLWGWRFSSAFEIVSDTLSSCDTDGHELYWCIEYVNMTSRRPCWRSKTKERRPCWRSKPVFWELNSIFMQNLPFVSNNQYGRWSRERTPSILCSLLCPETNMMWRSGTFASESKVMADALTEWLV